MKMIIMALDKVVLKKSVVRDVLSALPLNYRQREFCRFYARGYNATIAYSKAYHTNIFSSHSGAERSLHKSKIRAYVEILRACERQNFIHF